MILFCAYANIIENIENIETNGNCSHILNDNKYFATNIVIVCGFFLTVCIVSCVIVQRLKCKDKRNNDDNSNNNSERYSERHSEREKLNSVNYPMKYSDV